MTVRQGDKLRLTCKTEDPKANVTWYKNGKVLMQSNTRVRIFPRQQTLRITRVSIEDAADYACNIDKIIWRHVKVALETTDLQADDGNVVVVDELDKIFVNPRSVHHEDNELETNSDTSKGKDFIYS